MSMTSSSPKNPRTTALADAGIPVGSAAEAAEPNIHAPSPALELAPWSGRFDFAVGLPGSKSLTLRDCAIAALADGTSTIRYPGECDDYWRMKDCLRRLGIGVDDSVSDVVRITGRGGSFAAGTIELFTGQSAVSTRLLLAMAALLVWPRLVLFGFAIVDSHLIRDAFDSWLVAIAGFFLLPWTALAYASMWAISSDRVSGWEWAAVGVAFLLDVWAWSAFFRR